jgi:phosphoglycolate phosphatase
MKSIIWDWNGTLLNDLDFCISCINNLLKNRSLPILNRKIYKEVFSFPVKDYYEAIGFDFSKEDFSIPAHEFIDLYEKNIKSCGLHPTSMNVLQFFHQKGIRQFVLSAMHQEMLIETLQYNEIFHFFEGVAGLNDIYAVSKIERGQQLIKEFQIEKESAVIIGDTIHDFEVAQKLGIRSILVADGHQSEERLKSTGAEVVSNLKKLIERPF